MSTRSCFSCLTWRFESRAQHTGQCAPRSLPARLGDLSPTSARRPRAHHQRAATAHTAPAGSPPSSPPVGAVRRHVRRNGDRTARAGVENVINRRASAPRRRCAGEVLGHPRAAVRVPGHSHYIPPQSFYLCRNPFTFWFGDSCFGFGFWVKRIRTFNRNAAPTLAPPMREPPWRGRYR